MKKQKSILQDQSIKQCYLCMALYGDYSYKYVEDPAIIYMENRFKNGLKEVTDFISKFIP